MIKKSLVTFCIAILATSTFVSAIVANATPQGALSARVIRQVRHELVTLPYYGVFDWLEFEVRPDNTVVLRGQVVRPTTKSDEDAVIWQGHQLVAHLSNHSGAERALRRCIRNDCRHECRNRQKRDAECELAFLDHVPSTSFGYMTDSIPGRAATLTHDSCTTATSQMRGVSAANATRRLLK